MHIQYVWKFLIKSKLIIVNKYGSFESIYIILYFGLKYICSEKKKKMTKFGLFGKIHWKSDWLEDTVRNTFEDVQWSWPKGVSEKSGIVFHCQEDVNNLELISIIIGV